MALKALFLNCTLKSSPETSNTEALAGEVLTALRNEGVDGNMLRMADYDIRPGVTSDEGQGDQWPPIRAQILNADILVIATPTWLGHPSSVTQRVLERMDAMLAETDEGREWSIQTGRTMAKNLYEVATALQRSPLSAPKT